MEKEIEFKDIRVGDTIRREWILGKVKWTAETTVAAVHADDLCVDLEDGGSWYQNRGKTHYLVDRPAPKLPTEPGLVIIATKVRGRVGEWRMMFVKSGRGAWASAKEIDGFYLHATDDIQEWRPAKVVEATE